MSNKVKGTQLLNYRVEAWIQSSESLPSTLLIKLLIVDPQNARYMHSSDIYVVVNGPGHPPLPPSPIMTWPVPAPP